MILRMRRRFSHRTTRGGSRANTSTSPAAPVSKSHQHAENCEQAHLFGFARAGKLTFGPVWFP
jgi:hypothetical protein